PVNGTMRVVTTFETSNGETVFPIKFDKAQSYFIVFRTANAMAEKNKASNFPLEKQLQVLKSPWHVKFDALWGGPAKPVTFSTLTDWTQNGDNGIKYYSGTAVYTTSFNTAPAIVSDKSSPLFLDLGVVQHIARVKLNNTDLGVVWTAPWRIEIPRGLLKAANNKLEIEVTNVWANRLIGDEQEPADCEWIPGYISFGFSLKEFPDWFLQNKPRPSSKRYCFTTWNYFTKDSPLVPSGLLGPVQLVSLR
ncbi:MAG: glycosylhydrolase-like jelly roll fold domain-containing protein, partial [Bacteroidota bacterium]